MNKSTLPNLNQFQDCLGIKWISYTVQNFSTSGCTDRLIYNRYLKDFFIWKYIKIVIYTLFSKYCMRERWNCDPQVSQIWRVVLLSGAGFTLKIWGMGLSLGHFRIVYSQLHKSISSSLWVNQHYQFWTSFKTVWVFIKVNFICSSDFSAIGCTDRLIYNRYLKIFLFEHILK